jgi:hypothetical protein
LALRRCRRNVNEGSPLAERLFAGVQRATILS